MHRSYLVILAPVALSLTGCLTPDVIGRGSLGVAALPSFQQQTEQPAATAGEAAPVSRSASAAPTLADRLAEWHRQELSRIEDLMDNQIVYGILLPPCAIMHVAAGGL